MLNSKADLLQALKVLRSSEGYNYLKLVWEGTRIKKTEALRVKGRSGEPTQGLFGELDGYEEATKTLDKEIDKLEGEQREKEKDVKY